MKGQPPYLQGCQIPVQGGRNSMLQAARWEGLHGRMEEQTNGRGYKPGLKVHHGNTIIDKVWFTVASIADDIRFSSSSLQSRGKYQAIFPLSKSGLAL